MSERLIAPVEDNLEKYYTYKEYIGKYNRAIREHFYFEALLIDYAMMEDRLRSFLYHMGALNTRFSCKIDVKAAKNTLSGIVTTYAAKKESAALGISNISGKMKVIRCVLYWACEVTGLSASQKYESVLKSQLEAMDIGGMLENLEEVSKWCKYRNEVIHCLLNKNIHSVDEKISREAEHGFQLARNLDTYVRIIRNGNVIRRKMNLPVERSVTVSRKQDMKLESSK